MIVFYIHFFILKFQYMKFIYLLFQQSCFLYRCHFNKHRGIACILIATTAINSLRVISRWGTDLFPLETQRGPSGRRKKWEGKERKGRKGKGTKIEKERLSFSPNSLLPPLLPSSPPLLFCRLPFRSSKRQPILGMLYCPSSDGQLRTVISLLQY